MTTHVGVDWGSNGWVCAIRTETGWTADIQPSILSVWHQYQAADAILVDIPIGLPSEGRRTCDGRAKDALDSYQGRVFWTPPRDAVTAPTYAEAKRRTEDLTDGSLTVQAWGLCPRIREVDDFFAEIPGARGEVRESHPEVCFAKLSGGTAVAPSKQEETGIEERLSILSEHDERAPDAYRRFESEHIENQPAHARRFSASNRDDLVDAMVLALTGWCTSGSFATLPETPPEDSVRRVPLEIVIPEPE